MALVKNDRLRPGDKELGVLFNGEKVRKRREWRGLRDTLYDYTRWLYLWSIMFRVTSSRWGCATSRFALPTPPWTSS